MAKLINEVAHGVLAEPRILEIRKKNEPRLQPLYGEVLSPGRLAGRDFWQRCEMVYFDVNVFNPFQAHETVVDAKEAEVVEIK